MFRELAPDFRRSLSGSTFSPHWSFLRVRPDTITRFVSFDNEAATSRIFVAMDSSVSFFLRSFVPQCKIITSGFCSFVGITWLRIQFVVAPEKDLTITFFFSFDKSQPRTSLTIESPKIVTTVLSWLFLFSLLLDFFLIRFLFVTLSLLLRIDCFLLSSRVSMQPLSLSSTLNASRVSIQSLSLISLTSKLWILQYYFLHCD